jgi:glycosyltransferase involved in cell wall biosynthesis
VPLRAAWPVARPILERAVAEIRPDVIYAHGTAVSGYLAYQLNRLYGIPYVTFDADFGEVAAAQRFPGRRWVYERVGRNAFAMTTVSERLASRFETVVPGIRTHVARAGADPIPASLWKVPRPPDLRDRTVVVGAGIFVERKAFPALVRAFGYVADRHPRAVLRIVGDGAYRPAVEEVIRECGLDRRVHLLGLQPHAVVLQELVWADIFALIGRDEPFATVFSEAMAAQTPVISASDGGITEVIEEGVHGRLVPPGDVDATAAVLDRLLADQDARERMGRAARNLAESTLTWDAEAAGLICLFRDAAALR